VRSRRAGCGHVASVQRVDLDAYIAAHRSTWGRLDQLTRKARRPGRLTGAEVDELVAGYQATATHLSVIRSRLPDPILIGRLSTLIARARAAITGVNRPAWREMAQFITVTFPVVVWRVRRWWLGTAAGFLAVSVALAAWVASHPRVQASIATPSEVRELVNHDFAHYYSAHPATDFAAQVWTNNALVSAGALVLGVFLGLPTLYLLFSNAANLGVVAGFMAAGDRLGLFFGLITPHGLLELTAVFVAAGTGLRLGWVVVDPGPRSRADALGQEGRAAITVALGLVGVLLVSGVIEAFVTPSSLPTWARVGIGCVVEVGFLGYVAVLGRRAERAGRTGDIGLGFAPDVAPVAG
jgi:uncharacterized membrane protein SpoIIM required for sporulation